jgi:signal transduction histidine kinase
MLIWGSLCLGFSLFSKFALQGIPTAYVVCILIFHVCLILHKKVPSNLKWLLPIAWFVVITFSLPMFFAYMLFTSGFVISWQILFALSACLTAVLISDILLTSSMLLLGINAGFIFSAQAKLSYNLFNDQRLFLEVGIFLIFFLIFSKSTHTQKADKDRVIENLAHLTSHEMKTPLATLQNNMQAVQQHFPNFLKVYELAQSHGLSIPKISRLNLDGIKNIPNSSSLVIVKAFCFIDLLLANTKKNLDEYEQSYFPIIEFTEEAIANYPFSKNEKKRFKYDLSHQFYFKANRVLLVHVFLNLIRNALHAINQKGGGEISISIAQESEANEKFNHILFTDTGIGIAKEHLPFIFNDYYTTSQYGTGIGLTFCRRVLKSMSGHIECTSIIGSGTTFHLYLPKLAKQMTS